MSATELVRPESAESARERPDRPATPLPPGAPPARRGAMNALARLVARAPRRIVALVLLAAAVAGLASASVVDRLDPPGRAEDPDSESVLAEQRLAGALGFDPDAGLVALVPIPEGIEAAQARRRVQRAAAVLRAEPRVARVETALDGSDPAKVSRDGRATYVVAHLEPGPDKVGMRAAERVERRLEAVAGVRLGGIAAADRELADTADHDLKRAELLAFPILVLLSFWVFRGMVAALLPPLVGAITVALTLLVLRGLSETMSLAFVALNLVSGLGLGLAIDFSLFIVSRYREELARHGATFEALRRTMTTAGRTVLFSALTVASALACLLVFPQKFLYSMGVGGVIVPLIAAAVALVFLPAALALLGTRVNALSPRVLRRAAEREARSVTAGAWYRLSRAIMRRPLPVAAASAVLLMALGLPFLNIKFLPIDSDVLPRGSDARQVDETIDRRFAPYRTSPILVTVRTETNARAALRPAGAPSRAERATARRLARAARRIRRLDGVEAVSRPRPLADDLVLIEAIPAQAPLSDASQSAVRAIRDRHRGLDVAVGGETAAFIDQKASLAAHLPVALIIAVAATVIVLFLMTGSVVLPLKALLMNVLTLSAAYGLLVLVFQAGRFEEVLGYSSRGGLDSTQPILLAALVFGLSTDYGVFLLARIKEARDQGAGEAESVAVGLERTGRIVTAAALLFCVAIGAFATSEIVFIKEIGIGTAAAVLIDAFVIRALLVPSLMAVLGRRNWWAPGPLRRVHRRLGITGH